jgi:hypothetical protein
VLVQRRGAMDAEPLHDRKARAVDDGEFLVWELVADRARDLEVGEGHRLDRCGASDRRLEAFRRLATSTMRDEQPGLDQDVITRHEPLSAGEDTLRLLVASIGAVSGGVEDGGVDEEAQRADSTASPT